MGVGFTRSFVASHSFVVTTQLEAFHIFDKEQRLIETAVRLSVDAP